MIHAKDLFPIAMDRIHDLMERGHTNRTAKAQALLDAFEEGERKGEKRGGRKTSVRGANRVKRNADRVGARQMELPLT
tara:strand:- start:2249 stop:2482 length:234 start_codon:yes stop_codon:yes gene_type:complete